MTIPPPVEAIGAGWTVVAYKDGYKGQWRYLNGWTQKTLQAATTLVTAQKRTGDRFELLATVKTKAWRKVLREDGR